MHVCDTGSTFSCSGMHALAVLTSRLGEELDFWGTRPADKEKTGGAEQSPREQGRSRAAHPRVLGELQPAWDGFGLRPVAPCSPGLAHRVAFLALSARLCCAKPRFVWRRSLDARQAPIRVRGCVCWVRAPGGATGVSPATRAAVRTRLDQGSTCLEMQPRMSSRIGCRYVQVSSGRILEP